MCILHAGTVHARTRGYSTVGTCMRGAQGILHACKVHAFNTMSCTGAYCHLCSSLPGPASVTCWLNIVKKRCWRTTSYRELLQFPEGECTILLNPVSTPVVMLAKVLACTLYDSALKPHPKHAPRVQECTTHHRSHTPSVISTRLASAKA